MLNISGWMLKGSRAEEVWVRGEDGVIRPSEVGLGRDHLLTVGGAADPDLRRAVEAFVAAQWGLERDPAPKVPTELETYLKKLSLHAYRIIDEDIDLLREKGYTDEMIHEITLVGAVGTALVGLESLFNAMYAEV